MPEENREEILIRRYKTSSREAVRKICCDTAFMGEPMESFFDDREILADALTSYYTDYEPESGFVAECAGKVVGYLIGCKDTSKKNKIYTRKIFPKILFGFIKKRLIFKTKTAVFLLNVLKSFLKDGFIQPEIPQAYPAHLHINIDKDFRRFGLGTRLMEAFFEYLKKNNITGAHLSTFSEQGRSFFIKSGFNLLWERKTSQWRYLLNKDIKTYTFGKLSRKSPSAITYYRQL